MYHCFHKQMERLVVRGRWHLQRKVFFFFFLKKLEKTYSFLDKRNNLTWPAPHSLPWGGTWSSEARDFSKSHGVAGPMQFSSKDTHLLCGRNGYWACVPEGMSALEKLSIARKAPWSWCSIPVLNPPTHDSGWLSMAFGLTRQHFLRLNAESWIEWFRKKMCFLCSFCVVFFDITFHFQGSCFCVRMYTSRTEPPGQHSCHLPAFPPRSCYRRNSQATKQRERASQLDLR